MPGRSTLAIATMFYFTLSPTLVWAAPQLLNDPKCGSYYKSGPRESACSLPTTIQGVRQNPRDKKVTYSQINFSFSEIPTEGDLEYLLGTLPGGRLPDNLTPQECQEKFLSGRNPLEDTHSGVLPKLLSPDSLDRLCAPGENSSYPTRLEDWYKSKSYGEIWLHPEAEKDELGNIIACPPPKIVQVVAPIWGPMNVANALWGLLKSPAIDESQAFYNLPESSQAAFCPFLPTTPGVTLISQPPAETTSYQPLAFTGDRCAKGECETLAGPEEQVCFLQESAVLDEREAENLDLKLDLVFHLDHLSGENVTGASFSSFQAGEEIYYGYSTALVGTPDTDPLGEVIPGKEREAMGVYNIFLSPADIETSESPNLSEPGARDIPGIAPLGVNLPLAPDNQKAKYKGLGSVEAMQRYVCQSLLSPNEDPESCVEGVVIEPTPPAEEGDFMVEKTASPTYIRNQELPKEINFQIKVTAKYKSTGVKITNETTLTKKAGPSQRITEDKDGKDITQWPKAGGSPINLEADESWRTTYTILATRPGFEDSTLVDTVTVAAEGINKPPPPGGGGCEICGLTGQQPGWKSQELIKILNNAGKAFGVPAGALAGVLYYEGWHPGGVPRVHEFDDITVLAASKPGGKDPYCVTSSANARGPFQLTQHDGINGWPKYKNAAIEAGARPRGYTPEICNILDAAYAAAKKMRTDVEYRGEVGPCNTWRGEPPARNSCNWDRRQTFLAACRYYGKCGNYVCQNDPGGVTSCYCTKAYTYQLNYSCQEK